MAINHQAAQDGVDPAAVDRHVGARIRERRRWLGLSQAELGARLGVTFQQVQKYERGSNRVSASVLFAAARALRADVDWFFQDLPAAGEPGHEADPRRPLRAHEGAALAEAFARLRDPFFRRAFLAFLRAAAG